MDRGKRKIKKCTFYKLDEWAVFFEFFALNHGWIKWDHTHTYRINIYRDIKGRIVINYNVFFWTLYLLIFPFLFLWYLNWNFRTFFCSNRFFFVLNWLCCFFFIFYFVKMSLPGSTATSDGQSDGLSQSFRCLLCTDFPRYFRTQSGLNIHRLGCTNPAPLKPLPGWPHFARHRPRHRDCLVLVRQRFLKVYLSGRLCMI